MKKKAFSLTFGFIVLLLLGVIAFLFYRLSYLQQENNDLERISVGDYTFEPKIKINNKFQQILTDVLTDGIKKFKADSGEAFVMDVNDSTVLASVSLTKDPIDEAGSIITSSHDMNYSGSYEFGSIFKVVNMALALESKVITVDDIIDATHPFKLGRIKITDYKGQERPLTVPETLIHSSNIASAKIALKIGQEKQKEFFQKLGFFNRLPIRNSGNVSYNTSDKWTDRESATLGYGYGIQTTPVQLAAGISAMVNGGIYNPPYITHRKAKRVISSNVSEQIRHMLWAVTNYEAPENSIPRTFEVGGKTGSANLRDYNGHYIEGEIRTSFVGVFPISKPKYLVLVTLENPQKVKETHMFNAAGWNAKAMGIKIISEIGNLNNMKPTKEWIQPDYITSVLKRE